MRAPGTSTLQSDNLATAAIGVKALSAVATGVLPPPPNSAAVSWKVC